MHNYWYNLYDPGGSWRMAKEYLRARLLGQLEVGDRFFLYRGVPNMFLHVFRRRELSQDLSSAGFRVEEWLPLAAPRHRRLSRPWLLGGFRANGWIVVCQ